MSIPIKYKDKKRDICLIQYSIFLYKNQNYIQNTYFIINYSFLQIIKYIRKFILKIIIQQLRNMIGDYYGFEERQYGNRIQDRTKVSHKTERSKRQMMDLNKSPVYKSIKRTELSNQKLKSKDNKKIKRFAPPELRMQTSRQEPAETKTLEYNEYSSDNNQLQNVAKKYQQYKNAESFQFKNGSNRLTNSKLKYLPSYESVANQDRERSRYGQNIKRVENYRRPYDSQESRKHFSSNKNKRQEFLNNFQRQAPLQNDHNNNNRTRQDRSSGNNDLRYKKSRSLGVKLINHKMHTFYNADKRFFFTYNQQGYINSHHEALLHRIQVKAIKAFQRAIIEDQQHRTKPKKHPNHRKFKIQESSRIQHRNSDILSGLDYLQDPKPSSKKKSSTRSNKMQNVITIAVNPVEQTDKTFNDYQIGITSLNKKQSLIYDPNQKQQKQKDQASKSYKNVFSNFAEEVKKDDDSLLQFRPIKKKGEKAQDDEIKQRKSQLSHDYKSVDMMQINSNFKPITNEVSQKNLYTIEDNRSLGINTLKNNKFSNKQLQIKNSRSSQQSNKSQSLLQSSQLMSENQSSQIQETDKNTDKNENSKYKFNKNKLLKSKSLQDQYSQSIDSLQPKDNGHKNIVNINSKEPNCLTNSQRLVPSSVKRDIVQNNIKIQVNQTSYQRKPIKKLTKKKDYAPEVQQIQSNHSIEALGTQSFPQFTKFNETIKIKINPIEQSNSSYLISQKQSQLQEQKLSRLQKQKSSKSFKKLNSSRLTPKDIYMQQKLKSQASLSVMKKPYENSPQSEDNEYSLFESIRSFLEQQEYDYHEVRRQNEVKQLISQQLNDVLSKIQEHMYLINCMAQIILVVQDVYDFQTIYNKEDNWICVQTFLSLKKCIYERNRMVLALKGGKNCFKLVNNIIEDQILTKYLNRVQIRNILINLQICNSKLNNLIVQFYQFLIKFNIKFIDDSLINLKPFKNNEELIILLTSYDQQIDNLLKKINEELKGGNISPDDSEQYQMLMLVNERIFRTMQMGFIMSDLSSKPIKATQKQEDIYRQQKQFKNYIFQNHQLFKQMIKYFK